jgi:hypothetical protein
MDSVSDKYGKQELMIMKLSDVLLFPKERLSTGDGLELTVFDNDSVSDRDTEEFLRMLVDADSVDEVRMCLTLAYIRRQLTWPVRRQLS